MTEERPLSGDLPFWIAVVVCAALLALSITTMSLWIDEGFIAWVVDHRTPIDIVRSLTPQIMPSPADSQYPLYDLWMWLWTRGFGSSEYALRAANLPFGVLYVVALAWVSRSGFGRRFAWIPFAFAPFVWYYMNETRPYLMLLALSTATVAALTVYAYGSPLASARAHGLILPAFVLAWATHILALLLLPGAAVIYFTAHHAKRAEPLLSLRTSLFRWALPLLLLATFYGATLAGESTQHEVENNRNRGGPVVAFAGEIVYEQIGFVGLGPPRNDLRSRNDFGEFRDYAAILLLSAFGIGIVTLLGLRGADWNRTRTFLLAWAVSFSLAFVASEVLGARFLGRHLSAIFPLMLLVGLSIVRTRSQALLLFAIFATSDFRLTLLPEYWKDDYRGAVADVIQRQREGGGSIDWAADDFTANYYGLSLDDGRQALQKEVVWPVIARGVDVVGSMGSTERIDQELVRRQLDRGTPVYLALSKPDVFDPIGAWQATVRRLGGVKVATYRTFTIYKFESKRRDGPPAKRAEVWPERNPAY